MNEVTMNDYQMAALRTAKVFSQKTFNTYEMDALHAALGVGSDAGELQDAIKKHLIYGKPLDVDNVIEEIGDVLWFLALMSHAVGMNLEQMAVANIEKLKKRYPEKYSDEAAIARADKIVSIDETTHLQSSETNANRLDESISEFKRDNRNV